MSSCKGPCHHHKADLQGWHTCHHVDQCSKLLLTFITQAGEGAADPLLLGRTLLALSFCLATL
jgi:hypothetical protein